MSALSVGAPVTFFANGWGLPVFEWAISGSVLSFTVPNGDGTTTTYTGQLALSKNAKGVIISATYKFTWSGNQAELVLNRAP